jgi:hypothetical protein
MCEGEGETTVTEQDEELLPSISPMKSKVKVSDLGFRTFKSFNARTNYKIEDFLLPEKS